MPIRIACGLGVPNFSSSKENNQQGLGNKWIWFTQEFVGFNKWQIAANPLRLSNEPGVSKRAEWSDLFLKVIYHLKCRPERESKWFRILSYYFNAQQMWQTYKLIVRFDKLTD